MNRTSDPNPMSRRRFLQRGVASAGVTAAGALAGTAADDAGHKEDNPFEYKLGSLGKFDPALLHYERQGRFKVSVAEPRRLALGADNNLYIAGGQNIVVMSRSGSLVRKLACSGPVRCVAVEADGTVLAGLKERVEILDAKGRQQALWQRPAGRPFFTSLAVTRDDVFVADAGNRVILRYDHNGTLRHRIGEKDSSRDIPGLVVPSPFLDVEVGADGLLRVNNPGRHRVEVYTIDGELERFWGRGSAAIDGFVGCCNPVNLALLPDGRCITFEKGLPRVKIYSTDGKLECVVAGPDTFADPSKALTSSPESTMDSMNGLDGVVDADGRIYVLDLLGGDVHVMARKAGAKPRAETSLPPSA